VLARVFKTDTWAAIRCMALEEAGLGQIYAVQARQYIATLQRARPDITIEIQWYPAHKGVPGNEKSDEWAKLTAEKPSEYGMEWLQAGARPILLPRSLVHLK
jgi:ribonuclease HI